MNPLVAAAGIGVSSAGVGVATQQVVSTDPIGPLLQYGAIGVFAFLLSIAVWVLFQQHRETLHREQARADKLSEELSELRDKIQERYLITLAEASGAIREALAITRSGTGR